MKEMMSRQRQPICRSLITHHSAFITPAAPLLFLLNSVSLC